MKAVGKDGNVRCKTFVSKLCHCMGTQYLEVDTKCVNQDNH